jgi:hypothetical protein
MRKINVFFILFLLILSSCNKEKTTDNNPLTGRGSLVGEPELKGTFSKVMMKSLLDAYPDVGKMADSIKFDYDVDIIKVIYNTIDPKDSATIASGLLIIPKNAGKSLPLLSYQHGTILKKDAVPSRLKGSYEVGLIFGTEGYVVACPDYLGMGDGEKMHPYLHAKSEATAIIDMLKAAKTVCKNRGIILNSQLFLIGYSQGGHSTMAALKMLEEEYSTEFLVTACAPMAGPYDMSGTQLNFMLRDTFYPSPGYLPYVLYAYNNIYNMYPTIDSIFVSPYNIEFKLYFNNNPTQELGAVDQLWPSSRILTSILKPEILMDLKGNPDNPIRMALKDNDLINWAPKTPMHLCHCNGDQDVAYQNSVVAYNSFIDHGSSNIQLIMPLEGGTHETCAIPAFVSTIKWFNSLKQ